jgi:integrase
MCVELAKYLERRRRRWYALLDIPQDVRKHFDDKPRFVKSLQTESLTRAEKLCPIVIAGWKSEIEAARSGSPVLLEDMQALALEWRSDFESAIGDTKELYREIINEKADELRYRSPSKADAFLAVSTSQSHPTNEHIEGWLSTLDNEPKTIDMKRSDLARLSCKFPFTHQVNKQVVQHWAHNLQHSDGLKAATVRRIISACSGYWTYLQRVGIVDNETEPFRNAVERTHKKSKSEIAAARKHFKSEQAVVLVQAAAEGSYVQLTQLIWLGMWTGCRIEELCALKKSDVADDRFTIGDAKSPAGYREVPIHSRLKPAIACMIATSTDDYLISKLTKNKYGDRSNAIGKRFGRMKSKLGFGQDLVFHSLRRTVATQLENAGVPENVSADIVGHEKNTMTYGLYSGGVQFSIKLEAVEKLDYPMKSDPALIFQT